MKTRYKVLYKKFCYKGKIQFHFDPNYVRMCIRADITSKFAIYDDLKAFHTIPTPQNILDEYKEYEEAEKIAINYGCED